MAVETGAFPPVTAAQGGQKEVIKGSQLSQQQIELAVAMVQILSDGEILRLLCPWPAHVSS